MADSDGESDDDLQTGSDIDDLNLISPVVLPIDKKFHIFISHESVERDTKEAYRIDKVLRKRGFKCCLQDREIRSGEVYGHKIDQLIRLSVKAVFLLSKDFSNNTECLWEFWATERLQIMSKGHRPIIIILDECVVPDMMQKYTCMSMTENPEELINKLTTAINDQTDHLIASRKNINFVAVPCIKYNRDKHHNIAKCRYPHVCAKYIICDESCDGNCGKNHDLVTDQSREILIGLGFETDGHYESLLNSYIQKCKEKMASIPHDGVTGPCCYYNDKGCLLGEFHCPFTHICKKWFRGKCSDGRCDLSHNILNRHTIRLLEIFKINLNQPTEAILDDYREVYPHKEFLRVQNEIQKSKVKLMKENWLFICLGGAIIVLVTAFIITRFQNW